MISFDFKEALSFEGETGPYCQYAAVRANSIFRKLDDDSRAAAADLLKQADAQSDMRQQIANVLDGETGTEIWSLIMLAERLDEVINQCAESTSLPISPSTLLHLPDPLTSSTTGTGSSLRKTFTKKAVLIAAADIARNQLTIALGVLGISVPERM